MNDVRCKKCRGLLCKAIFEKMEIKCRKCGYLNQFIKLGQIQIENATKHGYDFEEKPIEAYFD